MSRGHSKLWIALLLASAVGCAGLRERLPHPPDVAAERKSRTADVVTSLEKKRESAQYKAAAARFRVSDLEGAREALTSLLRRNPVHPHALALVAQIGNANEPLFGPPELGEAPEILQASFRSERHDDPTAGDARDALFEVPSGTLRTPGAENGTPSLPRSGRDAGDEYTGGANSRSGADAVRNGLAALTKQNPSQAKSHFVAALASEPENARLAVTVAVLSLRFDQLELAASLAASGMERLPESAELSRVLGLSHYRLGRYKASQLALQQALSLDNTHPLSYFLLGHALDKLGETEAADWHLQEAARLDPAFAVRR